MADLNVGQAIALDTKATPYSGSPITQGLRLREFNQLKQAELEARKQAKEQKRRDMLAKFTSVKPINGIHPAFTQENIKLANEANMILTDPTATPAEKAMAKSEIAGQMILYSNYGKELNDFGAHIRNRQNLSYKGLPDFLNIKNISELPDKVNKYDNEDRLIMSGAYNFTPDGLPYVETPLKRQNVSDVFTKALARETALSDYDIVNKTKNFTDVKQSLDQNRINNLVENLVVDDPNLAYQLRFDNEQLTKKILREERLANPRLTDEELMLEVDKRLAREIGGKYYSDKYGLRTNPKDVNMSGYTVNGKTFNPSLTIPEQNLDAYLKAGVITAEEADYYKTALKTNPDIANQALDNLPDLIAIDPPNTGTFTIKDESGKTFKADNLKAVYVPKTSNGKGGQWFMIGNMPGPKGKNTIVTIPINERTYGNIISVYGKMDEDDIEGLFNKRMQDAGITNDKFDISPLKPQIPAKKQGTVIKRKYNPKTGKFENG